MLDAHVGLLIPIVDFILEQKPPICGEVLFIGKQQTHGMELQCAPGTTITTMDQSAYEGADIIWDLVQPVPVEMWGKYDFIYDGGSLDNIFNPAQAMMNFTRMLKADGRMICMAAASAYPDPYLMFSPGWFNDYYAANKFQSWDVYACMYRNKKELLYGPWEWYLYDSEKSPNGSPPPAQKHKNWLIVTRAQQGPDTTCDAQPIQAQYRHSAA